MWRTVGALSIAVLALVCGAVPSEGGDDADGALLSIGAATGMAGSVAPEAIEGFPGTGLTGQRAFILSARLAGRNGPGLILELGRTSLVLSEVATEPSEDRGSRYEYGTVSLTALGALACWNWGPERRDHGAGALAAHVGVGAAWILVSCSEGRFLQDLGEQYGVECTMEVDDHLSWLLRSDIDISLARDVSAFATFEVATGASLLRFYGDGELLMPASEVSLVRVTLQLGIAVDLL